MLYLLQDPVFLVFGFLTVTSVIGTAAHFWYKARHDEIEAALKQEMLQRGMSAEEIVQILQASMGGDPKKRSEAIRRERYRD